MSNTTDELESRVDEALKKAYRDGPEWIEVRTAVEALKKDRRQRIGQASSADAFNQLADAVARETEEAAKVVSEEAEKVTKKVQQFAGRMREAFSELTREE